MWLLPRNAIQAQPIMPMPSRGNCLSVRPSICHVCGFRQEVKGKGKGVDTCYSATYMRQTRDQQRFTISEVAADWHEPTVPQRIMWPSIARTIGPTV